MFRPIRVDHTNCLQVVIKTHSFKNEWVEIKIFPAEIKIFNRLRFAYVNETVRMSDFTSENIYVLWDRTRGQKVL